MAELSSINRPTGTMELKPITITEEIYRKFLISKVYLAIRAKFRRREMLRVIVQHYIAESHTSCEDTEIVEAEKLDGWNIQ